MSLLKFVKISNVSSLSDARYCAGMGVDILGFNLDPTTGNAVQENDYQEITEWVAGVEFAGEFSGASLEEIKQAINSYNLSWIEVTNLDLVEPLSTLGKSIIYKKEISDHSQLENIDSQLSYLDELVKVVVFKNQGDQELSKKIDEVIKYYSGNLRLLKGFDIQPSSVILDFPGIELEATEEEKPGFKDYGQIMDVLEFLEENTA